MENPIYISLSRQTALQRQMEMVANNIANMNTTAYKNQRMLFQEYVDRPAIGEKISLVQDYNTTRELREGPIQATNNPLDVALQGDGYFTVETMSGPRYTRAGHFRLNNDSELVDGNGLPVMGENDLRLQIPQNARTIDIKGDGTIIADNVQVGRIKVVRFEREQFMKETAGGLYVTDEQPLDAPDTKMAQGMLEQSNVQPVLEMTSMIEIMRQYQSNQKMMEAEHERQRTAISKLGRVSQA
ncbi:MAG TPA: flagellar basal-body rod protein FlgF [Azospirillaceae bacterium]|nr:flagellar basal-body rod protein FlgF [Azospirillaceae bacterium]